MPKVVAKRLEEVGVRCEKTPSGKVGEALSAEKRGWFGHKKVGDFKLDPSYKIGVQIS